LVRNRTKYEPYTHVVLDNASNDGTWEWLQWIIKMENGWFENVRALRSDLNRGDLGGVDYAYKLSVSETNPAYLAKLDNDMEVPDGWLTALVEVLQCAGADIVSLRRTGVQNHVGASDLRNVSLSDGRTVEVGTVDRVDACYIMRREYFEGTFGGQARNEDHGRCRKITSLEVHQMEGWDEVAGSYIQHEKYRPASETIRLQPSGRMR